MRLAAPKAENRRRGRPRSYNIGRTTSSGAMKGVFIESMDIISPQYRFRDPIHVYIFIDGNEGLPAGYRNRTIGRNTRTRHNSFGGKTGPLQTQGGINILTLLSFFDYLI